MASELDTASRPPLFRAPGSSMSTVAVVVPPHEYCLTSQHSMLCSKSEDPIQEGHRFAPLAGGVTIAGTYLPGPGLSGGLQGLFPGLQALDRVMVSPITPAGKVPVRVTAPVVAETNGTAPWPGAGS